jgi:hypothetical protein
MVVNESISWHRKWARVAPGVDLADETPEIEHPITPNDRSTWFDAAIALPH